MQKFSSVTWPVYWLISEPRLGDICKITEGRYKHYEIVYWLRAVLKNVKLFSGNR